MQLKMKYKLFIACKQNMQQNTFESLRFVERINII